MPSELFNELMSDINERQEELNAVQVALEWTAKRSSDLGKFLKVSVIVLGAFSATRDVADKIFPNTMVILIYTSVALAITIIGGIVTAFRYESRASDVNLLAVECSSYIREIDGNLPRKGDPAPMEHQVAAAHELIDLQNDRIRTVQDKSARLGVNINRRVRKIKMEWIPDNRV